MWELPIAAATSGSGKPCIRVGTDVTTYSVCILKHDYGCGTHVSMVTYPLTTPESLLVFCNEYSSTNTSYYSSYWHILYIVYNNQ